MTRIAIASWALGAALLLGATTAAAQQTAPAPVDEPQQAAPAAAAEDAQAATTPAADAAATMPAQPAEAAAPAAPAEPAAQRTSATPAAAPMPAASATQPRPATPPLTPLPGTPTENAVMAAPMPPALARAEDTGRPVDLIAAPFPQPPPPAIAVRVAILDASVSLQRAGRIAVLLTQFRKRELEAHLGMRIEVANISSIPAQPAMGNVVFYRPGFLRSAALLAKAIPGEQSVRAMPPERLQTSGVDVEILLGRREP